MKPSLKVEWERSGGGFCVFMYLVACLYLLKARNLHKLKYFQSYRDRSGSCERSSNSLPYLCLWIIGYDSWAMTIIGNLWDPVRRRRTALSVSCLCLVFVRISRKILPGVRLLPGFCPDSLPGLCLSGFFLSRFCPLTGFCPNIRKSSPLSVCPIGKGRDGAVRTFTDLVRRRLDPVLSRSSVVFGTIDENDRHCSLDVDCWCKNSPFLARYLSNSMLMINFWPSTRHRAWTMKKLYRAE